MAADGTCIFYCMYNTRGWIGLFTRNRIKYRSVSCDIISRNAIKIIHLKERKKSTAEELKACGQHKLFTEEWFLDFPQF